MWFKRKEKKFVVDNGDDSGIDYSDLSGLEGYSEDDEDEEPEFHEDPYAGLYIYDHEGNSVPCDWCHEDIVYLDEKFFCAGCGKEFTKEELMDVTGGDIYLLFGMKVDDYLN